MLNCARRHKPDTAGNYTVADFIAWYTESTDKSSQSKNDFQKIGNQGNPKADKMKADSENQRLRLICL